MRFGTITTAISKLPTGFQVISENENESRVLEILSETYNLTLLERDTNETKVLVVILKIPEAIANL